MIKYERSEHLNKIAAKVIEEHEDLHHLKDERCRIAYQVSDQEKRNHSKVVFADTEKVKDKHKAFLPYDFIITFYTPNTEKMSKEQIEILMYHELKHVGFNDGEFSIIPHDLEDFRDVINKYGIDWA